MDSSFVDLGWQIQYVVMFWIFVISAIIMLGSFLLYTSVDSWSVWEPVGFMGMLVSGIGLLTLPILILYVSIQGTDLMKDYEVTGTVISATNKFESGTGDLTNIGSPVVEIEGVSSPVFMNDDRIMGLVGEDVTLRCNGVWRYHADPYYRCEVMSFA